MESMPNSNPLITGPSLSEDRTAYSPGLHRFAIFISVWVFVLIVAGALVTSNDAGLSVPDWPTSFGSLYKIPPMTGGVQYEHGHRMIAQVSGLLTVIFAVWVQLVERRGWMKLLAWSNVGLVIAQGVLGGLTVLNLLPWWISTLHAVLGQTYFTVAMLLTIFASRSWIEEHPKRVAADRSFARHGFDFYKISIVGILAVYYQLFVGAGFRHGGMHFLPHLIGAGVTTAILLFMVVRALTTYGSIRQVRGPAIAILALLVIQVVLGFGAYFTRVEWTRSAAQSRTLMVWTTVAHVSVGALLLAHCFMIAIRANRHIGERAMPRVHQVVSA
jgi:cytochrome c oxidase assembly protein subunit 15